MTTEEFEEALADALGQLDPSARELIETVISGAETNHTSAYMAICTALGFAMGWMLG